MAEMEREEIFETVGSSIQVPIGLCATPLSLTLMT